MALMEYLGECKDCNVDIETRANLCPICLTQKVMKGKWKIVILFLLKNNTLRFSEIRKSIPKITQTYLSNQLKALEADKLINRKSYNQVPPKVEYSLTDTGKNFISVLDQMQSWGVDFIKEYVMPLKIIEQSKAVN